ncbi:hypothetical protein [Delftia sp. UGAL515B_04]|uniref:hypothetical protein n=1 Tax=Delftia sp. UGAL515B_04 TaxID=2986766 RepID=UPI002953E90B|nr:hypothetical protein [Delftia sp. UGAL515B_04]WON88991.1 hypothetical protein OK021_30450 [Delftia sp. UGAL515B_04]
MTLLQLLKTGAVLRYRPGFRFYAVQHGREISVNQVEAEAAFRAGKVRPEGVGPDKFGVFHLVLSSK